MNQTRPLNLTDVKFSFDMFRLKLHIYNLVTHENIYSKIYITIFRLWPNILERFINSTKDLYVQ